MSTSQNVTLVVLGASGDLTKRLLLPGLGTLLKREPERRVTLVGSGRHDLSASDWSAIVDGALREGGASAEVARRVAEHSRYEKVDPLVREQLQGLLDGLGDDPVVLYFALPPGITAKVCELLVTMSLPDTVRLGLEKPFGTDLDSARGLDALLHRAFAEEQIFRVDHFLGMGAVLNLLGFRFANRIVEPVWNATNIASVDIVFDETLALEGRAGYYDSAGALTDMIQSHLLLLCALVAMEDPARIDAKEFRDLVTHVLRATRLWGDDPVQASRRARYTAGTVAGRSVPNYVDEPGVDPDRETETLAELTVRIDNARWTGVPFRLRSGKALGADARRVVVQFRPVAHVPEGLGPAPEPNRLTIELNPERLVLEISTNSAGDSFTLEPTRLSADLGSSELRPYGEILAHIMDGDPILSVRGDMAEECWRIVTPVIEAWRENRVPLDTYAAGSEGPESWTS